jgi:hypothetical protein
VEELFKMWNLFCIATSSQDDELLKFFIYGKHVQGVVFCLELHINKIEKKIKINTKAPYQEAAHLLNQYVGEFLRIN